MPQFNIIPYPTHLKPEDGCFTLGESTCILADEANQDNAEILQQLLQPPTGYPLKIDPEYGTGPDSINLILEEELSHLGEEGYQIRIRGEEIQLQAFTTTGIFYAIQTLRQLLPAEIESREILSGIEWELPCVEIEDVPKFSWRGFMLDEGRNFQGIDTVKKLLDQMALFKLNRFHWHLTEDQGWRIEIKKYPLLTEIGSKRAGTVLGNPYLSRKHDQIPHQGFYTQDEIHEVVAYAKQRHIMVIPEIELPSHSLAALTAYPQFSCTGGPFEVPTRWGIYPDIYCAGKPETYQFIKDILSEVIALFPAPYIHIGGDESPKNRWKACPDCQQKIVDEGLANEHALQTYMVNQIAAYLREFGKRIIFWSDSFDNQIDPEAIVQFWVGNRKQILESIKQGRQVINSAYLSTYLDQSYVTIPLKKSQAYDPIFKALPPEVHSCVLGFEGLAWGEWLQNYRRVEYQTYPRLIALAESGWRDGPMPYKDFSARLTGLEERLTQLDIGFAPREHVNPPWWKQLTKHLDIIRRKTDVSLPPEEAA